MATLDQDVRYALRRIKDTPAFSFLAHLLYGVSPRDPLTLLAGPAVVVVVALMAIWFPARRAMALDPMAALRLD